MASGTNYDPNELLSVKECRVLFEQKNICGRTVFFREYRPLIKFQNIGVGKKRLRIPYKIAIGLIHLLGGQYQENQDPPMQQLRKYLIGKYQVV